MQILQKELLKDSLTGEMKHQQTIYIFGSTGSFSSTKSEGIQYVEQNFNKITEEKGGGKFGIGYSFNKYFAIELQSVNFGNSSYETSYGMIDKSHYDYDYRWDVYENEEKLSVETKGIGINFVAITPEYKNFSLFGKIGVHKITSEYKFELIEESYEVFGQTTILNSTRQKSVSYENKEINNNISTFALGLMYHLQKRWFITLEYEKFAGLSQGDFLGLDTEYDASLTSFGLGLRF